MEMRGRVMHTTPFKFCSLPVFLSLTLSRTLGLQRITFHDIPLSSQAIAREPENRKQDA